VKVYVTGASGFVGRGLIKRLCEINHDVTVCVRDEERAKGLGDVRHSIIPDIGPDTDWGQELSGHDVVVHLAARVHVMDETAADPLSAFRHVNVGGLETLAHAAANVGVGRVITVSSVKAVGEAAGPATPINETSSEQPLDPYGQSKLEADVGLRKIAESAGMGWTVLRPPLVYGPGVGGNFQTLMQACARRQPMPIGGIRNQRSMIYLGNLVDALKAAIEAENPLNGVFLVDDGTPVSTPELVRMVSKALDVEPRIFPVPAGILRAGLTILGKGGMADRLTGSLVIDSALFRRVADWTPPYKMVQGLAETASWYKSHYYL